jgi:hypothetical protein
MPATQERVGHSAHEHSCRREQAGQHRMVVHASCGCHRPDRCRDEPGQPSPITGAIIDTGFQREARPKGTATQ